MQTIGEWLTSIKQAIATQGDAAGALAAVDAAALAPWIAFRPAERHRAVVYRDADLEIVVVGWSAGNTSGWHDHGDAQCAFALVSGELVEVRDDGARVLAIGRPVEVPLGVRHDVRCPRGVAVTVHAYRRPLGLGRVGPAATDADVVVIGGGASAAALVLALRGRATALVVEPSGALGLGIAYRAAREHRLNVPAARMSILDGAPDHFFDWCRRADPTTAPSDFVSRAAYADYLRDTLAIEADPRVTVVPARAVDARRERGGWAITLHDGRVLTARACVLATGHAAPTPLAPEVEVAWPADQVVVQPHEDVLIIGLGLTFLDVFASLRAQGHRGRITAFSRRGRLPAPHAAGTTTVRLAAEPAPVATLVARVRAAAAEAHRRGEPWQAVLDQARAHAPAWWAALDEAERARFLRHVRPAWEVHRHRAPPDALAQVAAAQAGGTLEQLAARWGGVTRAEGRLQVTLHTEAGPVTRSVDRVLQANGGDDARRGGFGLHATLATRGTIRLDPSGLGISADSNGVALDRDGAATGPWLIGPALRADRFEATAIPEIRAQAAALADALAAKLTHPRPPAATTAVAKP